MFLSVCVCMHACVCACFCMLTDLYMCVHVTVVID